ncbi:hypothetical protein D9M68_592970 [compost metagenome]
MVGLQARLAGQGRAAAVEPDVGVQAATGHAETQGLQAQLAIVEQHMGEEIADGQFLAVLDALAGEGHVGVHRPPALGAELLHRQDLVRRLPAGDATGLLRGLGIGPDQRCQVDETQLLRGQRAGQLGPRLAGDVSEVAMDIATADTAVETLVTELRTAGLPQPGQQPAIGGIGRGFGEGHADQRIELGQALAG